MKLLISLLLAAPVAASAATFSRSEAPFTPELHGCEPSADSVAEWMYPDLTPRQQWFIEQEVEFLNSEDSETLIVPVYEESSAWFCGDLRNWLVAVCKGKKYGVRPALLIAVRTHENPARSRDHYGYGVVAKKDTDLWTQGEWAARIIARVSGRQGWDAEQPTKSSLYRLAVVYVGQGKASARHWSKSVWTLFNRAKG